MKKLFWIFLTVAVFSAALFCINTSANGSTVTVGNLTFTEYDTYCAVTGCDTSATGDIEIPSSVEFSETLLPVTSIGENAFDNCRNITSVNIPNGVTSIGNRAFYLCTSLASVSIPNGVTSIGENAFYYCSSLTNVSLPGSVSSIGNSAFYYCRGITEIVIPDGVTSIGSSAFSGCMNLTSVTIPSSVISIGQSVFGYYCGLESLFVSDGNTIYHSSGNCIIETESKTLIAGCKNSVIPDDCSVTSIADSAFYYCSGLTSITIPDSVTTIGRQAFYGCSSLTSVTIGNSVTTIGDNAFYYCSSLTYDFYGNAKYLGSTNNPHYALIGANYDSMTSVSIHEETKLIASGAFRNCYSLTSVSIPSGVTSIGGYVFYNCRNLTSVTIPDSVTSSIGNESFYNCRNLTSVTIPDSVTSIGLGAFRDCSSLTSVTIGNGVTSIGGTAFNNCSSLRSVTIGNSVTSIGSSAFNNCNSLTDVYITDVAKWCEMTFESNESNPLWYAHNLYLNDELITDLVIPDGITSIVSSAFRNCYSLTSLSIPDSVTSIGRYAFSNCSNLTRVTVGKWIEGVNFFDSNGNYYTYYDKTFSYIGLSPYVKEIIVRDGVTSINHGGAFSGCSNLISVTIPDSVTSIGKGAFSGCSSLTGVYITDLAKWCEIIFYEEISNPLYYAHNLYLNNELITDLVIPDGVTSINYYAFCGCSSTSVTIPDSVTSIGSSAFAGCSSLESITVPFIGGSDSSNSIIGYIFGSNGYSNNSNYVPSSLKEIIISDKCTVISDNAFYNCNNLTSVAIGNSVTSIGNGAFYGCSGLTSVNIPDSVTTIGYQAFYGCSSLTKIIIPDSIISINYDAFYDCSNLTYNEYDNALYLGNTNNPYHALIKPKNTSITNVIINEETKAIAANAFNGCSDLTSVSVGKYVEHGGFTNGGLTKVKEIIIRDGVTSICSWAFYRFSQLTSVTIPYSLTSIGDYAFYGCKITHIRYTGTPEQWKKITKGSYNNIDPTIHMSYNTILSVIADVGNVSINPDETLFTDDVVTLTAEDVENYSFLGWYEDDMRVCDTLIYRFTIDGNKILKAKYGAIGQKVASVTVNTVNGAMYKIGENGEFKSGSTETVEIGDEITLTAQTADMVLQWENASKKVLGRGQSLKLKVSGNMTVNLVYKADGVIRRTFSLFLPPDRCFPRDCTRRLIR